MKRFLKILGVATATIVVLWVGAFYYKNLRGVGPAVSPPPEDITTIINTTGMPLTLPTDFSISIFAKDLGSPRVMSWDPEGTMLLSIPARGMVVALPDRNSDGLADKTVTVLKDLHHPHGLTLECFELGLKKKPCRLYVAETDRVAVYNYDPETLTADRGTSIVDLPSGGNHTTRTLLITPERKLLIAVGSTCNVCDESDWRRAKILTSDLDGKNLRVFASGLRNSVFMTLDPRTGKILATEMGRDLLGDDLPPDEINIVEEGRNYGWPICYGKNIHDTGFDKNVYIRAPCTEPFEAASFIDIPAHSAPLGLAFVPSINAWPKELRGDLLVAYHGSWNRSVPTGYKVVRIHEPFRFGEPHLESPAIEDFITGWLTGREALGRPVDILFDPQKPVFYISDDKAGVVYRVALNS